MVEWPLWVAPALQVFSGDIRGLFVSTVVCAACLCFGIASTGPDEFREQGSNRLIDLRGPQPFPEYPLLVDLIPHHHFNVLHLVDRWRD
ncbi:hypothetical protein [Planktotalea sp.]|uniref:hypothetical protein n=1 Tax=Planktotalea sp. TaxID=2029877 RepID=UPI003F6AD789